MQTRRDFLKTMSGTSAAVMVAPGLFQRVDADGEPELFHAAGGTLVGGDIEKWVMPLVTPPAMPQSGGKKGKRSAKYDIAVRQFSQQILPPGMPETTVWSYGSVDRPDSFFYPAFTVEVNANERVTVRWINGLVDNEGRHLPHLLPIDQTLHWANPPGGKHMRDHRGSDPTPYSGPVPIVTHVHGAHVSEESDGYAEAWYLPDALEIPEGYARTGTFFDYFNLKYGLGWEETPGEVVFTYTNDQPATTLWYHDHTLGMTRANVYAGPAGFWLIRKGPYDADLGFDPPGEGDDPFGHYTEIPIAIQDRSFNVDGSLFYPDNRAFFEGLEPGQLDIPFIPEHFPVGEECQESDVSPIWNPEFFGDTMVVNGRTWPYLDVQPRRYRFRLLNGCNSRFLVLKLTTTPREGIGAFNTAEHPFWQIGADQGFLPDPVELDQLLMAPAERADVIVDFSVFEPGTELYLVNDGPDAPFGGITLEDLSEANTTGLVMKFVVGDPPAAGFFDFSYDPATQVRPWIMPNALPATADNTRALSLNELESESVTVIPDGAGGLKFDPSGEVFGPTEARLGTYDGTESKALKWADVITEVVQMGSTEVWEFYNFTADAHPMHIHLVKFQVVDRQWLDGLVDGQASPGAVPTGEPIPPEQWETGYKDTVIAYPGQVTRVKAIFDLEGFYVWHCHIVEHEDNEMMRPFHVGPIPLDAPAL